MVTSSEMSLGLRLIDRNGNRAGLYRDSRETPSSSKNSCDNFKSNENSTCDDELLMDGMCINVVDKYSDSDLN